MLLVLDTMKIMLLICIPVISGLSLNQEKAKAADQTMFGGDYF
jgi:hypothetical protein